MAKVWLAKFQGLPKHIFHRHLKETEWRHRHANRPCIMPTAKPAQLGMILLENWTRFPTQIFVIDLLNVLYYVTYHNQPSKFNGSTNTRMGTTIMLMDS